MRALLLLLAVATACIGSFGMPPVAAVPTGGDAQRGEHAIEARHCGSCHTIPGVTGAHGVIGPPLSKFAYRSYIAGHLPNTPDNLIKWIVDPPHFEPRTAMPAMGIAEAEARDVAAYLYTLR